MGRSKDEESIRKDSAEVMALLFSAQDFIGATKATDFKAYEINRIKRTWTAINVAVNRLADDLACVYSRNKKDGNDIFERFQEEEERLAARRMILS